MLARQTALCLALALACTTALHAAPFVVFPNAGQLASPDSRFVVRSTNRTAPFSQFAGDFHSLFLEETASGRSRKLCDYVGVVAVGWADSDFIIVTEYLNGRTSRALVFTASGSNDPVVIDKILLTSMVPIDMRPQLRENDHIFVEAVGIEAERLTLRVWGHGKHDANGFRWRCQYDLQEGGISCEDPTLTER